MRVTSERKAHFLSRHLDEAWTLFQASRLALDRFLATYYHARHYLGSTDRRALSDAIYERVRALPWPDFLKPYYKPVLDLPLPVVLRTNTLKITREELQAELKKEGIPSTPTAFSPVGLILDKRHPLQTLASFKDGYFEVQDEASQLVAFAAAPPEGTLVLDACAGAGGKALHLAAVMRNTGKILTHDTDAKKLGELAQRAKRAGAAHISAIAKTAALDDYHGRCDLVLVDAPCSSVGTIRRNPDLRLRVTPEAVARYATAQREILDYYAAFVRPGGTLLYVTCSFLREENEGVVEAFLTRYPRFRIDPILPLLGSSLPEIAELSALQTPEGFLRSDRVPHPWDGFFAARLKLEEK